MHHLEDKISTTPPPLPPFRRLKNPANSVVCLLCPLEECKTIIFKYHNGQHMFFLRNDTTIWIKFSWSFQTMLRLLFFFPLQENKLPRKKQQLQMGNFRFSFSTTGNIEKSGKLFICSSIIWFYWINDHKNLPGYTPILSLWGSYCLWPYNFTITVNKVWNHSNEKITLCYCLQSLPHNHIDC